MTNAVLGLSLIMLASAAPASPGADPSPATVPLLVVDGRSSGPEWAGAELHEVAGGAQLLIRNGAELEIGIRLPGDALRYADVYLENASGRLINFHTSMRYGERELTSGWDDRSPAFTWEPTTGWQGSTARRADGTRGMLVRGQVAHEGYELRIPARLIGPKPWRLRVELRDFEGQAADWVLPAGSARTRTTDWLVLP